MTTSEHDQMKLTITETKTGKPITSDSVRTGSRTYTWRFDKPGAATSTSGKSGKSSSRSYTAKYRNSSTGIIFTKAITATSPERARAQATAWQKSQGNWCTFVGVDGAPGEFFKKTARKPRS